ncbi:MAG: hypothetical protein ACYTAO_04735 [Planctomycetota bacterium]|jgi:hypothetical protein
MTAGLTATTGLNIVMMVLTPIERWYAARRLDTGFMAERWFLLAGVSAIVVLTALLIVVSHRRAVRRRVSRQVFSEYADRLGLTRRECQILHNIAARMRLRRQESVFTLDVAFERGAAEIVTETLAILGAQRSARVSAELSVLREKLGFKRLRPTSADSRKKPGSREIPVGKKLYLVGPRSTGPANIESTVIKNDDVELAVRLAGVLEGSPGELCCIRYNFGASVWEFDASVVSCHGGILVLNHSDDVRFINRRRFLRVPVKQPAFIARFPFARTLPRQNDHNENPEQGPAPLSIETWGPPEFVPAQVTELAGPGLRVEAPLQVKVGERVVVILKVAAQATQNSAMGRKEISSGSAEMQHGDAGPSKIVENIGQVRHAEATQDGFSIAVELTGLSDSNVNELIRATNAASVKAAAGDRDVSGLSGDDDYRAVESSEPALVQGV